MQGRSPSPGRHHSGMGQRPKRPSSPSSPASTVASAASAGLYPCCPYTGIAGLRTFPGRRVFPGAAPRAARGRGRGIAARAARRAARERERRSRRPGPGSRARVRAGDRLAGRGGTGGPAGWVFRRWRGRAGRPGGVGLGAKSVVGPELPGWRPDMRRRAKARVPESLRLAGRAGLCEAGKSWIVASMVRRRDWLTFSYLTPFPFPQVMVHDDVILSSEHPERPPRPRDPRTGRPDVRSGGLGGDLGEVGEAPA